jgi:predicted P-loop ATPase
MGRGSNTGYRDEPWWLTNGEDTELAREEQEDRYTRDPWEQSIAEYLEDKDNTSVHEILTRVIEKPPKLTKTVSRRALAL